MCLVKLRLEGLVSAGVGFRGSVGMYTCNIYTHLMSFVL